MKARTKPTLILIITILTVSFCGMSFLKNMKKTPEKGERPEIKHFVKAESIKYSTLNSTVEASGRVTSHEILDIGAEVQGRIINSRTPLKAGQRFKKGEMIIRIDDSEARLDLLGKKSRFLNSVATILPDIKVDFPESFENWAQFFNNISIENNLPKFPETKSPKEKIFLASQNILSDYYEIKSDEVRLGKYTIEAPFTGTYQEIYLEKGAVANPGSKIARIIGTENLELEIPVPASSSRWIQLNDTVDIISESSDTHWTGTVIRKADFIDASTQSLTLFIKVTPQKGKPLLDGLYLKAIFNNISLNNVMKLPRNAVFNENEVFIIKDGKLKKHLINIRKLNNETVLFDGPEQGQMIVTEPLINAVENMKVHVLR